MKEQVLQAQPTMSKLSDSDKSFNDERTGSAGTAYDVQTEQF